MERSSRVLHHGNPEIWFIFQKSSKFEFWLLTKSWNHLSFVNISPTKVIDTSMERSSRMLQHENQEIWFFFKRVRNWIWLVFWLVLKSLNQHSSRSQHAPICRHRGCIVVPLRVDIYTIFRSILQLWKSILQLWKSILHLWKSILHLWKSILHLWKSILHLWKSILHLWKSILHLWKSILALMKIDFALMKINFAIIKIDFAKMKIYFALIEIY